MAAKIDDAGRAGLRGRRREEENESSIELLSYEAELPESRHRTACFERLYSRFRSSCRSGQLVTSHEHALPRPPKGGPVDRNVGHGFPPFNHPKALLRFGA